MVSKTRKFRYEEIISTDFDGMTLKEVRDRVEELIRLYGVEAFIDDYQPLYSDSHYQYVWIKVPETDEEMQERIQREKDQFKINEAREAEEFKRLSLKFGSKK